MMTHSVPTIQLQLLSILVFLYLSNFLWEEKGDRILQGIFRLMSFLPHFSLYYFMRTVSFHKTVSHYLTKVKKKKLIPQYHLIKLLNLNNLKSLKATSGMPFNFIDIRSHSKGPLGKWIECLEEENIILSAEGMLLLHSTWRVLTGDRVLFFDTYTLRIAIEI